MPIDYRINAPLNIEQFIDLLQRSTLGERRPLDNPQCLSAMLNNATLLISAWRGQRLVGLARSLTDFHYACYLSDLAVCQSVHHQGIGKQLIKLTRQELQAPCKLILLAAPAADLYYEKRGFKRHPRCWYLD